LSIRNLRSFFRPRSVTLVGASSRRGSVGNVLARNLQAGGFGDALSFVNLKRRVIFGVHSVATVDELPDAPELAVIATPPASIPDIVARLGERGTRAAVIVTAGFASTVGGTQGEALTRALADAARPHGVRIIGPGCLGVLAPPMRLNASFSHLASSAGGLAFVAQSGAIVEAVQDWAEPRAVGFSHLVSLGEVLDVDFGDMLDYLATDPRTDAILLYVEGIRHSRKFMSAARAAARIKPVLAVKAGRFEAGRKAAAFHSGALAGSDAVYDAAFRRSGILRVHTLEELFGAVETLALARRHRGSRLAIVTNGGGLGVLAADALSESGGRLATLSEASAQAIAGILPGGWAGGNPVDVQGDASGGRYEAVLRVMVEDPGVDAVLVINCPTSIGSRVEAAQAVANVTVARRGKTLLASWVGAATTPDAQAVLRDAGVPSYDTPERAIRAFMQLVEHGVRQDMLLETPPSLPEGFRPQAAEAAAVLDHALEDGRDALTEEEARRVLTAYAIPVGEGSQASQPPADGHAARIEVREDGQFGPVLLFGQGGAGAELAADAAIGFPPLNLRLAHALMESTRLGRVLEGSPTAPGGGFEAAALTLVKVSQLVVDLPQLRALSLDPVVVHPGGVEVRGVRVQVRPAAEAPTPRLAIRPYPKELETEVAVLEERELKLRPVLPEDEPELQRLFDALTPEEVRLRFFVPRKAFSHRNTARFTQIDYDREMVLVLTEPGVPGSTPIHGLVQLISDPDNEKGEYAILVARSMTGQGLGRFLMQRIVGYARARGMKQVFGDVLADNSPMLRLVRSLGFTSRVLPGGAGVVRVELAI
jgi:acyl-CoA synthetase (NDP forming)/RimJ/RimL family protein N-acetyltransferase